MRQIRKRKKERDKKKEREEQIKYNFKCTNLGEEDESGIQQIY